MGRSAIARQSLTEEDYGNGDEDHQYVMVAQEGHDSFFDAFSLAQKLPESVDDAILACKGASLP